METIAGLSGAAIGYTLNNLPGAYLGYKAGQYLARRRNMAPISRKRKSVQAARQRFRKKRKTFAKVNRYNNNITTVQRDTRVQYVKKRMPKYKKKKWISFTNKVKAALNSDSDFKTVVFNTQLTASAADGNQQAFSLSLYGNIGSLDGTSNACAGANDLRKIFNNESQNYPQDTDGTKMGKFKFDTGVIDITLRNTSPSGCAEVDIYEIMHWKNTDQTTYFVDDFNSGPVQPIKETSPANATLDNVFMRGITLFDKGPSISRTGCKILKKRKLMLEAGHFAFLQHRDAKNHSFNVENTETAGYGLKGVTFTYCIIWKSAVGTGTSQTLSAGVTRKYAYRTDFGSNIDRSAFNP